MLNFSLNSVPYTLKSLIISNLEPEDSFQLLRVNREFRHSVLNHGLSPRTITRLTFQVSRVESIDGVPIFEHLWILLRSKGRSYKFTMREHRHAPDESGLIGITQQDLLVFGKMHNFRKMRLRLHSSPGSTHPLTIDLGKLLNKFRFIDDLEIEMDKIAYLPAILASLPARIENKFSLILRAENETLETFGGSEICEFISSNLIDCKEIRFHEIGPIGTNPSVYAALQKTNFSELRLELANADGFWASVQEFLKIGAPSLNGEAMIVMIGQETETLEYPAEIDEFLRRHTVKVDDPDESRRLMDESSINYTRDKEITMFRRILAQDSQILYIFELSYGQPWFRAKVKPVFRELS